ncbi:carboxymuconolactone decarboxylase family protein [Dactylosporangium sp. NPDC049140]|uniref:carboxymuconolactone decarboxylase family protein n=1 Tax=Dactylosporangium sp. NPDC049140 TaxID=3155647 RepID=UPI0033E34521
MTNQAVHTLDTAPGWARPQLAHLQEAFGFVPSTAAAMADSPALLHSFFAAFGHFRGETPFTPAERQVLLLLSNAVANVCTWAMAFHTLEALQDGVPPADVEAIRRRRSPADPRLRALSALTRALVAKRGRLGAADTDAFVAAGFDRARVLDVVAGVAISTMTNYTATFADAALQDQYREHAWDPEY